MEISIGDVCVEDTVVTDVLEVKVVIGVVVKIAACVASVEEAGEVTVSVVD